jgi:hypothetical protein
MYRIREVDGQDDNIADKLAELHRLTFFNGACVPEFEHGHWWLVFHESVPVAFAGVVMSTRAMRDISAGLAYRENTAVTGFNCA